MKQEMLINAVHPEQKRMANVENGKLIEFNIQMSFKEPITGNIYKGVVLKVERGLQAAFVNYGGKKDGFLPLRDVSSDYFTDTVAKNGSPAGGRPTLKSGQEILVQVLREVSGQKGALLTSYISLPGRYLVLLPNKQSSGVSRKIEDESDRQRLKEIVEQIKKEEGLGFIVRTAGMNRTKQELSRDYQHLLRLWEEINKKAKEARAPALIYQESDFGVKTLRDYFTPEISEILVDDAETLKKMRAYCKAVSPRNINIIKLYKDKTPIFDKYNLEDQIRTIYQDRVALKSGGSLIIRPTDAMITIDVNSGRGSNKRNVEETAFRTNFEAAEEIARQLRLRDLGGLIAIDFIDMEDKKNIAEVEKTFKKALSVDRARIQMARISKFGILELSRQKKHSTIQEISYVPCPHCQGSGSLPSLEYMALSAFRKIESQAVRGISSRIKVTLPHEMATYLLNQKRIELSKIEALYDTAIHIAGAAGLAWDAISIEATDRKINREEMEAEEPVPDGRAEPAAPGGAAKADAPAGGTVGGKKKTRRGRKGRHKKAAPPQEASPAAVSETAATEGAPAEPVPEDAAPLREEAAEAAPPAADETPAPETAPKPAKTKKRLFSWRRKKKAEPETPESGGTAEQR